jgi:hypothetical protein
MIAGVYMLENTLPLRENISRCHFGEKILMQDKVEERGKIMKKRRKIKKKEKEKEKIISKRVK